MIKLYPSTTVYVLCPAHVQTGGTESLHNLVMMLCKLGHRAKLVYDPPDDAITPGGFRAYHAPYVCPADIVDSTDNLLIAPEIWTEKLDSYTQIQKAVWWLSVDEHFRYTRFDFRKAENAVITHLAQSDYVECFLQSNAANQWYPLNASLNPLFYAPLKRNHRADRVLYNPVKGSEYLCRLKEAAPDIEWVAIKNMTRAAIASLMRHSKVYVDFGHFPGRDRMPREAVLCGCCIVIGDAGSAGHCKDFPVHQRYRFTLKKELNYSDVITVIRDCLSNFDQRQKDFDFFRNHLMSDKKRFVREIRAIFGNGTLRERIHNAMLMTKLAVYLSYKYRIKLPIKMLLKHSTR